MPLSSKSTKSTSVPQLNSLLESAFGSRGSTNADPVGPVTHELPPRERATVRRRPVPKESHFNPVDFESELPEEDYEIRRGVRQRIAKKGTHALAFYVPYLNTQGHDWGIYFDTVAMDVFACDLFSSASSIDSSVTFAQTLKFAYDMVMYHEMEHFAQEVVLADSVNAGRVTADSAIADWASSFTATQLGPRAGLPYREVMATRNEMTDGLSSARGIEKDSLLALKIAYRDMPLPYPYARWNSTSIQIIRRETDTYLGHGLPADDVEELRRAAHYRKNSKVPVFYFFAAHEFAALSDASMRSHHKISCRRLEKMLVKPDVLEELNIAYRRGRNHDLVFIPANSRSIPLDCHALKNEPVPSFILREFSTSTGFSSTSAFIDFLLR